MNSTHLLQADNISKSFPGVRAINNVSLHLDEGKVLAVTGENGAGKSTLMKLAVKHAAEHFPNGKKISFFFNAKGTQLEKSMEGMYRSLLHQLLTQCAWLEEGLDERAFKQPM